MPFENIIQRQTGLYATVSQTCSSDVYYTMTTALDTITVFSRQLRAHSFHHANCIKHVSGTLNLAKTSSKQIPPMRFSKAPTSQMHTFKQDSLLRNTGLPPQLEIHICTHKILGDGLHTAIPLQQLLLDEVLGGLARVWKSRAQVPLFTLQ